MIKDLELKLTIDQVNVILVHLAKGAYNDVADIITEIHKQSREQLSQASGSANATETIT
jgi:hypothetical protein